MLFRSFKLTTRFSIVPQSLPALRFGRHYRLRGRAVDLCGNSLRHDAPLAHLLALLGGLPQDSEGFAYLRYAPVVAPIQPPDASSAPNDRANSTLRK